MDYDLQSDEKEDESDKYYLLAKQHAQADVLTRTEKKEIVVHSTVSEPKESYRDFTPKFNPVPTPVNADEKWQEVVARLQRLEERALHGD